MFSALHLHALSWQEAALEEEWGVGAMAANPDEHIPDSAETHRLAIVDLDWDKIRAVDILAVLRSFLGQGQSIRGVTVYPSDFGLEKMQEEAAIGPQVSHCLIAFQESLDVPLTSVKMPARHCVFFC